MGPQYACQSISHLFYDNTLSQSPHHARHPYHEERQQEEDGGVAEGVAHAVVEEWPISDMTSNMQPLTGLCGTSWEPHRATGREPLTGFMGMTEHARHHPRRGSISVGIRVGAPAEPR